MSRLKSRRFLFACAAGAGAILLLVLFWWHRPRPPALLQAPSEQRIEVIEQRGMLLKVKVTEGPPHLVGESRLPEAAGCALEGHVLSAQTGEPIEGAELVF